VNDDDTVHGQQYFEQNLQFLTSINFNCGTLLSAYFNENCIVVFVYVYVH